MKNPLLLGRPGTRWAESQQPGSQRSTGGKPEPDLAFPDDGLCKARMQRTVREPTEGRNARQRRPWPPSQARGTPRALWEMPSLTPLDTGPGKKSPAPQSREGIPSDTLAPQPK